MLKIKDNVYLKELEKFGFEEIACGDYEYCVFYPPKGIYVDADDRIISFSDEWYGDDFEGMDIIFDLINAELVEKIKEEE